MAKLSNHQSNRFVKILYLGDSGTGKTGSLVSLVKAGYSLRVLDYDNGLDVLKAFILKDCPDKIDQVDFETLRDKYKAGANGPMLDGPAKALIAGLKLMSEWSDKTIPAQWGEKTVFVLDSLTGLGKAAFEWAKAMNPLAKDPRQWYKTAQDAVDQCLALLTSEPFQTNVILIAHVQVISDEGTGLKKGYANTIGKALGPFIPTYFNTMVLAQSSGTGGNVKRTIATAPTSLLDLKNPVPFKIENSLPLDTGLATLFEKLKGQS